MLVYCNYPDVSFCPLFFLNENCNIYLQTFVPSFRLVRQTILHTSSCQIMVQKSKIVLGFGPIKKNPQYNLQKNSNHSTWSTSNSIILKLCYPELLYKSDFLVYPINIRNKNSDFFIF